MDLILNTNSVSAHAISTMLGHVAQRSNVCAKVIDAQGEIIAVNRRGLELLNADQTDVCGAVWTCFWDGDEKDRAEAVLSKAFTGKPAKFTGEFFGTGERTVWDVEAFPLDWREDQVVSVLVVSRQLPVIDDFLAPEKDDDMQERLSDVLHTLCNIANVNASCARMLNRAPNPDRLAQIASALETNAGKANEALAALQKALGRSN